MTSGGRNLIILGIASVIVAATTTGVSLAWYHNSGDIYLDRSRPGYLPDEEEIGQSETDSYALDRNGNIDSVVVSEYLENLEKEIKALDTKEASFDAAALSDAELGI